MATDIQGQIADVIRRIVRQQGFARCATEMIDEVDLIATLRALIEE